jgi:hypothetical protein
MKKYAMIDSDNKVTNIIVASSVEIFNEINIYNVIEYTDENPAGIGWSYDGTNFIAPDITPTEE